MPKSSLQRAAEEALNTDSRSTAGSAGKAKRKSKPTGKTKNRKKKIKNRYSAAREEAQLAGVIPTTPDGAVRDERTHSVDPLDGLPALVRQALKEQWDTPGKAKQAIMAQLLTPFFNEVEVMDKDGNIRHIRPSPKLLNELARTILALDQTQWERDNPVAAGQAKGASSTVAVSVQSNMLAVSVLREALERDIGRGETGLPAPAVPSTPGYSRFDGEVEVGAASTSDE